MQKAVDIAKKRDLLFFGRILRQLKSRQALRARRCPERARLNGSPALLDAAGTKGQRPSWSSRLRHAARRDFLIQFASAICGATALGVVQAVAAYLRPNAPLEPSSRVLVGNRDRVRDGTVVFDKHAKVILVGVPGGMYAMSAVCPHLGCMTSYRSDTRLIECACHGSAFNLEGAPLYGPSGPLRWLSVEVNQQEEIVVDTAAVVAAGKTYKGSS